MTKAGSLTLSHKLDPQQRTFICRSVSFYSPASNYSVPSLTPPTLYSTNKQPSRCCGWNLLHADIKSLSQIAADKIAEALGVSPLPRTPSQGKQIEKPKSNVFSRTRPQGGRERPPLSTLSLCCYFLSQNKAGPREVNLPWIEQGHSLRYRASCGPRAPRPRKLSLRRPRGPRGSG